MIGKRTRTRFVWKLDDWRIRRHLSQVENLLRQENTTHLSPEAQASRKRNLDLLRLYRQTQTYPRNDGFPSKCVPYFLDTRERPCAVAYLILTSKEIELAEQIVLADNNAYIKDMNYPQLKQWAQKAGLTTEELALIQPSYSGELIPFVYLSGLISLVFTFFNALNIYRHKKNFFSATIGFIVACTVSHLAVRHDHHDYLMLTLGWIGPNRVGQGYVGIWGVMVGGLGLGISLAVFLMRNNKTT